MALYFSNEYAKTEHARFVDMIPQKIVEFAEKICFLTEEMLDAMNDEQMCDFCDNVEVDDFELDLAEPDSDSDLE